MAVLKRKGSAVWWVHPGTRMIEALRILAEKDIGALLVLEEGKVVGIVSERDYARRVGLNGNTAYDTRVEEIMSRHVLYARPEQRVDECMALMTAKHIRHLPVIDDTGLIGVISISDVVAAVISDREFTIDQLVHYVTG
jgi:CBS domain-containing protein